MKVALVTGGSSGIGYEFAKILASKGHDLILVARGKEELADAQKRLVEEFSVEVETIEMDLSQAGSAQALHNRVKNKDVGVLINNAGFGHLGNLIDDDLAVNQSMAHLNMITVMELLHFFGARFKQRGGGKILNTASVAAFIPGPRQPVYYASKAFVRSLGRSLAGDLKGTGVTVTTLHPGATKTKFWQRAGAGFFGSGASAEDVAKTGYRAMMAGKVEVVHGFWNKLFVGWLLRLLPGKTQVTLLSKFSRV